MGEAWTRFSHTALRRNRPCRYLSLGLPASSTVRQYLSVIEATQFAVCCYSSLSLQMHSALSNAGTHGQRAGWRDKAAGLGSEFLNSGIATEGSGWLAHVPTLLGCDASNCPGLFFPQAFPHPCMLSPPCRAAAMGERLREQGLWVTYTQRTRDNQLLLNLIRDLKTGSCRL